MLFLEGPETGLTFEIHHYNKLVTRATRHAQSDSKSVVAMLQNRLFIKFSAVFMLQSTVQFADIQVQGVS